VDREHAVGHQGAVRVGEEQGARLGVAADLHVGLGEADLDAARVRAGMPVDLLAQQIGRVDDVLGPGEALGGGAAARVPVHVDEVDVRARDGQHGADLDARVHGLHGGGVRHHLVRVHGGRLVVPVVGLPGAAVVPAAVVLVADGPVLRVVLLGDVGVPDPARGLLGRAGAVVRDDHRLGADPLRPRHERVKVGVGGHVPARRGVRLPVVDVGVRAARIADHLDAGGAEQIGDGGGAELLVPDRVVDAERRGGDGGQSGAGVDGDGDGTLGG
jgi:hypothetical protein